MTAEQFVRAHAGGQHGTTLHDQYNDAELERLDTLIRSGSHPQECGAETVRELPVNLTSPTHIGPPACDPSR